MAIPISFTPVTITAVGYPSAVVDMNNDHLDDIVAAGTDEHQHQLSAGRRRLRVHEHHDEHGRQHALLEHLRR
jgi:hypothetical protein